MPQRATVRVGDKSGYSPIAGTIAANAVIYAGNVICKNAAGYFVQASATTGLEVVGMAEEDYDNTGGSNGAFIVEAHPGTYLLENSTSGEAITIVQVLADCYIAGGAKVQKTNGDVGSGATTSKMGLVLRVESKGVHVRIGPTAAA